MDSRAPAPEVNKEAVVAEHQCFGVQQEQDGGLLTFYSGLFFFLSYIYKAIIIVH